MRGFLGNLILACRMQHVSQALIAAHLGISQSSFSNKIHGLSEAFTFAQQVAICRCLRMFEPADREWLFAPVELTDRRPGPGDRHSEAQPRE